MKRLTRHVAALGVLAVTVLAVAVGSPASAFARAAERPADNDICVGLIVDASALDAGVDTDCATVEKGSTGVDVLDAAGHELTVCRDGIIGEIDGRPANGCETKDSSHYWAYWHRAPGSSSWTYATEGPATYEPRNESTEGWVWQNGGDDNVPPPPTSYRRICPPSASPSPSHRETPPPAPPTVGTNAGGHTGPTAPAPAPPASVTATTSAAATATASPKPTKHRTKTAGPSASPSPPTPTIEPTSDVQPIADPSDSSGGIPLAVILAIVAVAVLGGATAWQVRRQRNNP